MIRASPYVALDNAAPCIQALTMITGQAFSVVPEDLHPSHNQKLRRTGVAALCNDLSGKSALYPCRICVVLAILESQ